MVTIDSMHQLWLGVAKQFLDLWFKSKFHKEPWYLGKKAEKVNKYLEELKYPDGMKALPLEIKKKFKGS